MISDEQIAEFVSKEWPDIDQYDENTLLKYVEYEDLCVEVGIFTCTDFHMFMKL